MLTAAAVPASVHVPVPVLDAERLDSYRVAVEFQVLASTLVPKGQPALRDQLERASVSIVLNTAERESAAGRGETSGGSTRWRAGSAMECAAILELLALRQLAPAERCHDGRALLVRIVQMLTRLEQRMSR
jgi:four helix bundle protein